MKKLKILSIMLLAAIWTILFAYVLFHGSSDILLQCYGRLSCSLLCFSSLLPKERKSQT